MRLKLFKHSLSRSSLWNEVRRSGNWEELAINLGSRIPYEWANRLLSPIFRSERLQSRLFHKTLERLRKIEAWIDGPVELKEAVGRHIFVHAGMKWRLLSMGDMSLKRARKFITIEGLDILE